MTTNAVNFKNNEMKLAVEKEIADLDRKVDFQKLGISRDELMEKIRHNQVEEYLNEKKVDADDRNGFMKGLGSILKGVGLGGAIAGLAAAVNDESYHNKLTVAYEQATNLPFNEKAGNPHFWEESGLRFCREGIKNLDTFSSETVPNSGIVEVKYVPTIAVQDQEIQSSELQNNVRLLFTKVRSANSGAVNQYDQSDLFQFTLASSDVFEVLRLVVRPLNYIYAKRKQSNIFTAWDETVLSVMTGNYTNARRVIRERTEYIQAINSCIRANNAQALPIGFDLTKRRSLLNGRIFCNDGDRDEIYIFSPTCYYVYDEANGRLVSKQLDLAVVFSSPENVANLLREMLQPLVNGTATSIMAGDMKKAYARQVSTIRELPYTLKGDIYSKDEHILLALRNANVLHNIPTYGTQLDIKQGINTALDTYIYQGELENISGVSKARITGDNAIFCSDTDQVSDLTGQPAFRNGAIHYYKNFIDVNKDQPERYDIMSATRFKNSFSIKFLIEDEDTILRKQTQVYQWGSEIITNVMIWYFPNQGKFDSNTLYGFGYPSTDLHQLEDPSILLEWKDYATRFHYVPMIRDSFYAEGSRFYACPIVHGRYNMTLLTDTQLLHLNNASFGSLISIKEEKPTEVE